MMDKVHSDCISEAFHSVLDISNDVTIVSAENEKVQINRLLLSLFSSLSPLLSSPISSPSSIILPDCSMSSIKHLLDILQKGYTFSSNEKSSDIVETAHVMGINIGGLIKTRPNANRKEGKSSSKKITKKQKLDQSGVARNDVLAHGDKLEVMNKYNAEKNIYNKKILNLLTLKKSISIEKSKTNADSKKRRVMYANGPNKKIKLVESNKLDGLKSGSLSLNKGQRKQNPTTGQKLNGQSNDQIITLDADQDQEHFQGKAQNKENITQYKTIKRSNNSKKNNISKSNSVRNNAKNVESVPTATNPDIIKEVCSIIKEEYNKSFTLESNDSTIIKKDTEREGFKTRIGKDLFDKVSSTVKTETVDTNETNITKEPLKTVINMDIFEEVCSTVVKDEPVPLHTEEDMSSKNLENLDSCQVCFKDFSKNDRREHYTGHFLKEMTRYEHLVKENRCTICNKVFVDKKSSLRHIGMAHEKVDEILLEKGLLPTNHKNNNLSKKVNDKLYEILAQKGILLSQDNTAQKDINKDNKKGNTFKKTITLEGSNLTNKQRNRGKNQKKKAT